VAKRKNSTSFVPDADPELQALLTACQGADDPMPSFAVLSDWLEEHDDPRANLVRLWARYWQLSQKEQWPLYEQLLGEEKTEHEQLERRLMDEGEPIVHDWLEGPKPFDRRFMKVGPQSESVELHLTWGMALLDLEVKAAPEAIPKLGDVARAGWVWRLEVAVPEIDDIFAELLPSAGPIRNIRFYENKGLRNGDLLLLGQVPCLRELDLRGTRISDAGLPHLAAIRSLRLVDLEDSRVSDAGITKLEKALPECTVLR
jgi:hypothetical protein